VPLDAHEEAQFRRITARLRDEDPSFGRSRRSSSWAKLGRTAVPIAALAGGLALLPAALATGVYPLGGLGYLAATLGATRLAAQRPWRRRRGTADHDGAAHPQPKAALARAALVVAGVAIVALAIASPGAGPISEEDPAPQAATDGEGSAAEQAPPITRRTAPRIATTTAP
jgi:hypothetical protein